MQRYPIIYLNGLPGTGKFTIAQSLRNKLEKYLTDRDPTCTVKLVHNHLLINPADAVLHRTQPGYQHLRKAIRSAVFSSLVTEPETYKTAYIFTDWQGGNPLGASVCQEYLDAADARGCLFFPIIVSCNEEENLKRLAGADRKVWAKVIDPALLVSFRQIQEFPNVFQFDGHPLRFEIDVSSSSADEAAESLLHMLLPHILK